MRTPASSMQVRRSSSRKNGSSSSSSSIARRKGIQSGRRQQSAAGDEDSCLLLDEYPLRSDADLSSTTAASVAAVSRRRRRGATSRSRSRSRTPAPPPPPDPRLAVPKTMTRRSSAADADAADGGSLLSCYDDCDFPYLSEEKAEDKVVTIAVKSPAAAAAAAAAYAETTFADGTPSAAAPLDEEEQQQQHPVRLLDEHRHQRQDEEEERVDDNVYADDNRRKGQNSNLPWTAPAATSTATTIVHANANNARGAASVPFGSADDDGEDGPPPAPSDEEEEAEVEENSSSVLLSETAVRSDDDYEYGMNRTAETIRVVDHDDDQTVHRTNATTNKGNNNGRGGGEQDDSWRVLVASSLGVAAGWIWHLLHWCCLVGGGWDSWLIIDEDDVIAAATTTAGIGKKAVTGFMAVAAAKNVSGSLGTGHVAAAAAAAAAGGAAGGGAAGNASTTATQAGVVVTAVAAAAVVAGMVAAGDDQVVSLPCPNVTNAGVFPGSMALDFLLGGGDGDGESTIAERRRLTIDQAAAMGATLVETYNEVFGCQSEYNRLIVNCTVPCDEPVVDGVFNSSSRRCCERLDDPVFGNILRCSFDCFVHCAGCLESEPLFEDPADGNYSTSTITTLPETSAPLNSTTLNPAVDSGSSGAARLLQSDEYCSPQCLIGKSVEDVVCGGFFNGSSCVAIRSFTFETTSYPGETSSDFTIVAETPFIDAPSAQPSAPPSVTGSTSPSSWPSREPTVAPSLRPSNAPTLRPSRAPTRAPSQAPTTLPTTLPTRAPSASPTLAPSALPTLSPTISPTQAPSALPTLSPTRSPTSIVDLVLYNGNGDDLGSLLGTSRVSISQVGPELTVRAMVTDLDTVDRVDFYFDGSRVNREDSEPYYLNKDQKGVGFAYPPLSILGEHNVTALAEKDGVQTGRQTAIFRVIFQ